MLKTTESSNCREAEEGQEHYLSWRRKYPGALNTVLAWCHIHVLYYIWLIFVFILTLEKLKFILKGICHHCHMWRVCCNWIVIISINERKAIW